MLFEHWQAWGHNHFPGEFGPVFDCPVSEDNFPNIQSSLPLMLEHIGEIIYFSYSGKSTWN